MDVKFLMIRQNVTLCVMKAVNIQAFFFSRKTIL